MTTAQLITRLRNLLNESSAGTYTDAQLYTYLDSGQNFIISNLLSRQNAFKSSSIVFEYETLKSVLKQGTISTTTANSYSLTSLSDFIQLHSIEFYNSGDDAVLQATEIPYYKINWIKTNTYAGHSYNSGAKTGQIFYALRGTTLQTSFGVAGFPNSDFNTIRVNYYYAPTTIDSGVNPALEEHTHEALLDYAYSLALRQDGRTQEAIAFENTALQKINGFN